jgi:hypothetical protein
VPSASASTRARPALQQATGGLSPAVGPHAAKLRAGGKKATRKKK